MRKGEGRRRGSPRKGKDGMATLLGVYRVFPDPLACAASDSSDIEEFKDRRRARLQPSRLFPARYSPEDS